MSQTDAQHNRRAAPKMGVVSGGNFTFPESEMKVQILFFALVVAGALAAAAVPARAQIIVSQNSGYAHDCFIHAKLGKAYDGIGACDMAIKNEALSRKDMAATYDNRGVMLDQLGKIQRASDDFNMAIKLQPDLGDPYVNLGVMLIKERKYEAALDQINKGMDLGMGFPHLGYYDRAIAEQMLGHYKEAYYDYKKVLEIEPAFTSASERLKDFTVTTVPAKSPG
jgi:tetratricopeptide (TPR) repeat protein